MTGTGTAGSARRAARLDPDELAGLEEQRDFLLRSLADLEREHDAGDLDDHDYETLRDDYTARAAEVLRAIDDQRAAFEAAKGGRSLGQTALVLAGVVVFAAMAGWLVARSMGARQAGDTLTGGIDVQQSPSQRAQQCIPLLNPTDPTPALDCFKAVLDDDPRNPVANTWIAWQIALTARLVDGPEAVELQQAAAARLDRAVELNPSYSYARAFRAVVAFQRGEYELAQQYLEEFEENDPSPDARQVIAQQQLAQRIEEALVAEAEPDPVDAGSGEGEGEANQGETADGEPAANTSAPAAGP